jgi:hypothetical protein
MGNIKILLWCTELVPCGCVKARMMLNDVKHDSSAGVKAKAFRILIIDLNGMAGHTGHSKQQIGSKQLAARIKPRPGAVDPCEI